MNSNDIISSGLLELYASGLSSPEESIQVQQWIKDFPEVKAELLAIEQVLETYAMVNGVIPPAEVKDKILQKIGFSTADKTNTGIPALQSELSSSKIYRIPVYFKLAAAACLVLLVGSLLLNYNFYHKYQNASSDLQLAQNRLNQQKELTAGMNKDMTVMTDKYALPVVLNGTPHAPDALAKIYWMKNTGEIYIDPTNLPQVPSGKQYQLWAIINGKPVDAGMISTQHGVFHIQKMKTFGKAEAFAITMEKEGGSPTPTMEEMYVIAKI
ncbi:MAG: anti-sigma factor [Ginsengibacter sp.]